MMMMTCGSECRYNSRQSLSLRKKHEITLDISPQPVYNIVKILKKQCQRL